MTASLSQLVSKNVQGGAAGGPCFRPLFSSNGRFLAFACWSGDIVVGDDNDRYDTFLLDRSTQQIRRVSLNANNQEQRNHSAEGYPSADGRFVVFAGEGVFHPDVGVLPPQPADHEQENVFLRTFDPPQTELLGRAANGQGNPGTRGANMQDALPERHEVLFSSDGDYLGDASGGGSRSLFLRNWQSGAVERITARPDGGISQFSAGGQLSPDGRFVVMSSIAADLTSDNPQGYRQLFLRDRLLQNTRRLTFPWSGGEFSAAAGLGTFFDSLKLSQNAQRLMFVAGFNDEFTADDNPGFSDVYVQDVASGKVELVSRRQD
ncbi:hypothetical protein [Tahibacter aquaticus]|uniref:hypothetical protein n=1 Tax=Tahibacter aquaticus TaxID=520092 RepID=UPI00105E712F|nr:hypothetical protein [Tahibacter aquaticus]